MSESSFNLKVSPIKLLMKLHIAIIFWLLLKLILDQKFKKTRGRIHNTLFSSYLKYKPIKLECFITPH